MSTTYALGFAEAVAEIERLTAENARLRAEVVEANRQTEASMRAHGRVSNILEDLTADLARVTGERDALWDAAQATIDTFEPDDPLTEPTYNTPRGDARAALRAAVEACK
jgi:hypothetical protein